MTWLYLSLGATFCYVSLNILSRKLTVESENPRAFALVFNIICIIMAFLLFIFTGAFKRISIPSQTEAWIFLLIASIFYGLNERIRFLASKMLEASVYSVLSNVTVVIAFFLSLFLYKEELTVTKFVGFILIVLGIILVTEIKKSKINIKGIILGLTSGTLVGIAMGLDKKGAIYFNPETYNILIWVLPFLVLYFPSIVIKEIKDEFIKFNWKIILLALTNFVGFYLGLKAFLLADATKVILIIQTTSIFTVIAGIFLLNEKSNLSRKILAGIIAFAGVFLLR